jgi:hypothetical protein
MNTQRFIYQTPTVSESLSERLARSYILNFLGLLGFMSLILAFMIFGTAVLTPAKEQFAHTAMEAAHEAR